MKKSKMTFEDIYLIEGILTEEEKRLLYNLAKKCEGDIVEIGSWKGLSTICLALGLKEGYKVYAIDPHRGAAEHKRENLEDSYEVFIENIRKFNLKDKVVPLRMTSKEAFESWDKGEIGLLWIDGNHEYEYVKYDFENWSKLLKKKGIVAMHDFGYSPNINIGVRKVVFECVLNFMNFIKKEDSTIVFVNDKPTKFLKKAIIKIIFKYHEFVINHRNNFFIKIVRNLKSINNNSR